MDSNKTDRAQAAHPRPTPIDITPAPNRYRSGSVSSDSSDGSPSDPLRTPPNLTSPKVATASPPTSPFFSYIMGQQPPAKTFPFRRGTVDSIGSPGPVFDDDDTQDSNPASTHKVHRRATTSLTMGPPHTINPLAGPRQERASGLLRRLSLSTSFSKPQPGFCNSDQPPAVPPNTALPNSPTNKNPLNQGNSPPRRTVKRAPSPMGERILKGHFDGFN